MASEICQTKSETVLKTAGKLCNSGEIGHMHILYCKVAQQTKFVISEAEGFFFFSPPRTATCWEGEVSCRSHVFRSLSLPKTEEGKAGQWRQHGDCSQG